MSAGRPSHPPAAAAAKGAAPQAAPRRPPRKGRRRRARPGARRGRGRRAGGCPARGAGERVPGRQAPGSRSRPLPPSRSLAAAPSLPLRASGRPRACAHAPVPRLPTFHLVLCWSYKSRCRYLPALFMMLLGGTKQNCIISCKFMLLKRSLWHFSNTGYLTALSAY